MAAEALDCILDGLEAELELARELGVRSIEIDRGLLAVPERGLPSRPAPPPAATPSRVLPTAEPSRVLPTQPARFPFVFLHDRPLSPAGMEMMAKIVTAMGKTLETAPVVVAPPLPDAKVYVVLGARALKQWFPGLTGAPNQWLVTETDETVLVSNSPEYILRFKTVTPALKKIKLDMWQAIKSVLRRV